MNGFAILTQAITELVADGEKAKLAAKQKGAKKGKIQGDLIIIDGKSYPFALVVDLGYTLKDNDIVTAILAEDRTKAVVVGI